MGNIKAIFIYTLKQHLRTRVYLAVLLFGFVLIFGSMVISTIALEERIRMLLNAGLGGIELLALITIIFTTVTLVLEELESRSIYLILTHPLRRSHYLLGRYLGTLAAVGLGMLVMIALHVGCLYLSGWSWQWLYFVSALFSFGKIMVISSVALLFSLFSTSAPASMVFTVFIWLIGHFSEELKFMGEKSSSMFVKIMVWIFYHSAPNLQYYNYRDFWIAAETPDSSFFAWVALYSFAYTGICLMVSNFLFSQKEF